MQKCTGNLVNYSHSKNSMVSFLFSMFLCFLINFWFFQYFFNFSDDFKIIMSVGKRKNILEEYPMNSKYILVWNKYNNILQKLGIKNGLLNCSTSACVLTDDKILLYDYIRYDAIIFDEFILNSIDRPNRRSKLQFYIFSSQSSSKDVPACKLYNDNFFNLTFTYKIDSDVLWSYILVRNLSGDIVAPKSIVNWENSVKPASSEIKSFLIQKRTAAIWLVNNDKANELNLKYIARLQEHLFQYSLQVDIYGNPPLLTCQDNNCQKTIRDKYYFYMAFENYYSVDHVTDIVLNGYYNYAVPVVYGGANYSRFLPPGSYINARNFHPYNLATEMYKAIKDPNLFAEYFRWTNLYTIHDNSKSYSSLCNLCETIDRFKANGVSRMSMKQFRRWWNDDGMKRCMLQAYWSKKFL